MEDKEKIKYLKIENDYLRQELHNNGLDYCEGCDHFFPFDELHSDPEEGINLCDFCFNNLEDDEE